MNAVRIHEYGGPDVLNLETVSRPVPDEKELLVRVRAAGVNPIDWMVREGYVDDALAPSLPFVPGWDLSGVIEAVGSDCSAFETGDSVFGLVGIPDPGNAYAEYAVVPASDVIVKPETLSHREAGAIPMAALTAWQALFEHGQLRADQRVLIHGSAGGVGHMAVQFASHAGAHVIGTASGSNEAYLRSLGVDAFVNYREQRFEQVVDGVDVVLDAVGGETLERSISVLNRGGRLITLPEPPTEEIVANASDDRNATVHWFSVEPDATTLTKIRALSQTGAVTVTVSDLFSLSKADVAHRKSQRGHVRGKLVLDIGDGDGGV